MADIVGYGNKRIIELNQLGKLTGKELMLIDTEDPNGETMKVTVDSLLGYIAKEINAGNYPESIFTASTIVEIPEGEDIPIASRVDGNYYLRTINTTDAKISAGIDRTIVVSPNMALELVDK